MSRKTTLAVVGASVLLGLAIHGLATSTHRGGGEHAAPAHGPAGHVGPEAHGTGAASGRSHGSAEPARATHDGQPGAPPGRHADRQARPAPRPGDEVRDLTATDHTGEPFRLGELRRTAHTPGEIAVLTFWCTTCHSCRGVERDFDELAREYAGKGVLFRMVDSTHTDTPERVQGFLAAHELGFTVLMDAGSAIARYFGARLTTTTAVIDADGRLRYFGGFRDAEDAIRSVLAGEPVAVPESPGGG